MYSELSPSPFLVGPPVPALGELEQKEGLLGFAQFQGDFYLFLEIVPFLRIWGVGVSSMHWADCRGYILFLLPGT